MAVKRKALGTLSLLSEGGATALVHRTAFQLPGDSRPLVFKEIRPDKELAAAGFDRNEILTEMKKAIAMRDNLSPADQQDLDSFSAWPICTVQDGGQDVGLLMPEIPPEFYIQTKDGPQPCDLGMFVGTDGWATANGIDRSAFSEFFDRSQILINLVYAVARLHKLGIVFGDLSFKNAAFSPVNRTVMLLDCDATAMLNDPNRRQANSPNFFPPELANKSTKLQDTRTDVYKLALLIIRGMSKGQGATALTTPDHLEKVFGIDIVNTLRQALDPNPNNRPTSRDLFFALKPYLTAQVLPPTVRQFCPLSTTVPRGMDVIFTLDVTSAKGLTGRLKHPDGSVTALNLTHKQVAVQATTGTYRLELESRRSGKTELDSEPIYVFDPLPPLDLTHFFSGFNDALADAVPDLPTITVPDAPGMRTARPAVELSDFMPEIPAPHFLELLDTISTETRLSPINVINDSMEQLMNPLGKVPLPNTAGLTSSLVVHSLEPVQSAFQNASSQVTTLMEGAHSHLGEELQKVAASSLAAASTRIRNSVGIP